MKSNKILENRPELTPEQIIEGMDFNKIKNHAALAKPTHLKSVFIKGFFGIVIISSLAFIYKNYQSSGTPMPLAILVDSVKTITPHEQDTSIYHEKINDQNPATVVKTKTILTTKEEDPALQTDSDEINSITANTNEVRRNKNNFKSSGSGYEEETGNTYKLSPFTTVLGQVDIKEINKSLVKIKEGLYASKFEVSNKLYMTFLNSLKKSNNSNLVSIAQIDTLKWRDKLTYNEPYVHYYHTHPAYNEYPVVNISYEAAKLFCEWLTLQYNSDSKRKFKKVLFRLPSEGEWIEAAEGGNSEAVYAWEGKDIRNKKGQVMANFKREGGDTASIAKYLNENADITAPVQSYWKNNFGLYNMSGNVAEMINEKGIAKGGGWINNSEHLKIESIYKYEGNAQPFVGFRYFVELITD